MGLWDLELWELGVWDLRVFGFLILGFQDFSIWDLRIYVGFVEQCYGRLRDTDFTRLFCLHAS